MNKPTRILAAIIVSLVIGGMNAHNDSVNMTPGYQAHPVVTIIANFFWAGLVAGSIVYFGSGWLAKRKERNVNKAHNSSDGDAHSGKVDDKFYDEVARELQEKSTVPGLWTKAYAEMGGDDAKARALYIKYRVAQLIETNRTKINSFTYELFDDEYRGEIPLSDYGRQERMMMYEQWRKQKIESLE